MKSKIGNVYTYYTEDEMLRVANYLEAKGFEVERLDDKTFNKFYVKVIGYK